MPYGQTCNLLDPDLNLVVVPGFVHHRDGVATGLGKAMLQGGFHVGSTDGFAIHQPHQILLTATGFQA